MKPLTVRPDKDSEHQLKSIGWKSPSGDDCRRHFFALGDDGKVFVFTPKPAMPESYVPLSRAKAVLCGEPFPEAVCVEIRPCRLLPPPCYQSWEEFDSQLPAHYKFEPWRAIYWKTHEEILVLDTSEEVLLKKRFDQWLAEAQADYEREVTALQAHMEHLKAASVMELGLGSEEQRLEKIAEFQPQLDILQSDDPIQGIPSKGWLKLTFDDIKRGCEGLRDTWMHEIWAAKNGEDLAAMHQEQIAFRWWLEHRTGTPANVFDATRRERRDEVMPPDFGESFENNPQFLEACARVRYRARFADNANTVVYLTDCEIREELTADERKEAASLTEGQQKRQTSWHSEGFAAIHRLNEHGDVIDTLPLNNEFRALCQLLSEFPDNIAQFSEIEPKIGIRAHELDIAAGVSNPALKGERRIRDLLQNETGHCLREWGVLIETKIGREKFLTLSAPKPA